MLDIGSQIRFKKSVIINNGDLSATWSIMRERGWSSKESLAFAIDELLHYEFLIVTREGGRHWPTLYGFTFYAIDECGAKLDVSPTKAPAENWKMIKTRWTRPARKKPVPRFSPQLPRITGQSA